MGSVTVANAIGTKVSASIGWNAEDNLSEAKLGIAKGKKISAAKLRLVKDPEVWSCKLDQAFTVSGLRLPFVEAPSADDDPDAVFLERVYLMERFWDMLDTAFVQFLYARLNPELWKTVVAKINLWLRSCVAKDNKNIAIQSQGHTEHIYKTWINQRVNTQ